VQVAWVRISFLSSGYPFRFRFIRSCSLSISKQKRVRVDRKFVNRGIFIGNLKSIKLWKQNTEHVMAQKQGREIWYREFKTRICKVESDYGFSKNK